MAAPFAQMGMHGQLPHMAAPPSASTPAAAPTTAAAPSSSAAPSAPASPPFAVVIPGRPLATNWQVIGPNKLLLQLPQPATITEISVTMLQPSIPQDHAVAVYYSIPNMQDWQYLGSISLTYPTACFRAVWRDKIPADCPSIGIGLSVETAATVAQMHPADTKEESRTMDSAMGIAKNLYEFMASYSQNTGQYKQLGDVLVIPTNCIDKWMAKFQQKHKMEPYFWIKKDLRPSNMH